MEEAITAQLLAAAGLTALVGTRIHWGQRPQGSGLPIVVLNLISERADYTTQGPSGLVGSLLQVDAYAATYGAAKAVSNQVLAVLDGMRADSPAVIQGVFREGKRATTEDGATAGTTINRRSLDLRVWHHEP